MEPSSKTRLNPWPVVIISYFIFFITLTVSGVIYLSRQKMDLVRSDYYDDEIRYQEQLDRLKRTQPFGGQVVVSYSAASRSVSIALPRAQARSFTAGRIRLYRPSDETLDQDIALKLGPDGSQHIDATNLATGLWKVRLYWTSDGNDYCFNQTIVIKAA